MSEQEIMAGNSVDTDTTSQTSQNQEQTAIAAKTYTQEEFDNHVAGLK